MDTSNKSAELTPNESPALTPQEKAIVHKMMRRSLYVALAGCFLFVGWFYSPTKDYFFRSDLMSTFTAGILVSGFTFLITLIAYATFTGTYSLLKRSGYFASGNGNFSSSSSFEYRSAHSVGWYNDLSNPANPMSSLSSMHRRD